MASALFDGNGTPEIPDSKSKKYVILHGGSGNQLFQWAYAHYLNNLGLNVACLFVNKKYSIEHASNCISSFIKDCSHTRIDQMEISDNRILQVLKDPTHRKNPAKFIQRKVTNNSRMTFSYAKLNTKGKYLIGYFQNSDMIHHLKNNIATEIENNLRRKLVSNKLVDSLKNAQIIHIRQGDTMTSQNRNRVGVLGESYYRSLPLERELPVIVLTDDVEGAKKTLGSKKIDGFYGPSDLDVPATLGVMAAASKLFCANSTLAWWGGILALNNGAEVFIPDPFFLNVSPDPDAAFHYPGFKTIKSEFMS